MPTSRLIALFAALLCTSQAFCISSQEVLARMIPGADQDAILRARLKDQGVQFEDFSDFEELDAQAESVPTEPATLADWSTAEAASFVSPVWVGITAAEFIGAPWGSNPMQDDLRENFHKYGSHVRRKIIEEETDNAKKRAFQEHENKALMNGHWSKYLLYLIGSKLATDVAYVTVQKSVKELTGDSYCVPVFAGTLAAVTSSLYNHALFGDKSRLISKEEILSNATADTVYETAQQGAKALWNAKAHKKRRFKLPIPQWLRDRGVTEKTVTSLAESGASQLAMFIIKPLFIKPHTDALWGVTQCVDKEKNIWKNVHNDPPIYATHRY